MQQQVDSFQSFLEMKKTTLSFPDNAIQLYLSKNQEFEDAHNAIKRLLNFYSNLQLVDKVYDMEIYLKSFNSYLSQAN